MTTVALIVAFLFISLAANHIGLFATKAKLPLITGYLIAGAVVGPFVLGWITMDSVRSLAVVDHLALAFIAFAAGGELYLKEVRSKLKSITYTTIGLVLSTFTLSTITVLLISDYIPFLADFSFTGRLAVAFMAAAILVARSPSSAIAIINELRARGSFTKTTLGVTVVMDAVVIILFALCASIAHPLINSVDFNVLLILQVVLDLLVSLNVGYITGKILAWVVETNIHRKFKIIIILAIGFFIFWISGVLKNFSHDYLHWPIHIESLLTCMIAGFVVTNTSPRRSEFEHALKEVAPVIYLVFFTLIGASLAFDSLIQLWPIALVLFVVRLLGIIIGSVSGGLVTKSPRQHVRVAWMAYVTQAGVGLGLAKDVAAEFPSFGSDFATMIIAVIVINQIVGPPLFKFAIKKVGESHLAATAKPDEIRNAIIIGIDDQSLALAQQLISHNWVVVMADTDKSHVTPLENGDIDVHHIKNIDEKTLTELIPKTTDALVAMMGDDEANYRVCEFSYERLGVSRLIVRLNDLSQSSKFDKISALVVEPASAMVNLLDQFVRLPQLASLLLHRDQEQEVVQITVADRDIEGLPLRELRLPSSVRVLGITRENHAIVVHGHTILRHHDEVTLVGDQEHLDQVASRWGY